MLDLDAIEKRDNHAIGPPRLSFVSTHPVEHLLLYDIPALIAELRLARDVVEAAKEYTGFHNRPTNYEIVTKAEMDMAVAIYPNMVAALARYDEVKG
mgnify:CR=1 FL=1